MCRTIGDARVCVEFVNRLITRFLTREAIDNEFVFPTIGIPMAQGFVLLPILLILLILILAVTTVTIVTVGATRCR